MQGSNAAWRLPPGASYNAGPDGNTVQSPLTTAGLTANYGTLVAQIDGGPAFAVGSSFSGTVSGKRTASLLSYRAVV